MPMSGHEIKDSDGMGDANLESATLSDAIEAEVEAGLGAPTLAAALEALLLVSDEPVSSAVFADFLKTDENDVITTLTALMRDYAAADRGFELRQTADGWRMYTAVTCSDLMTRWARDGQRAKLTQAALETLAVIAYKQPMTRARIAAIRGVNVDGVVRSLVARGLITESGTDEASQAMLYRTTPLFLERLGVEALSELPAISPLLPDIDDAVDLFDAMNAS
jgi:segregation and condensation protein B